MSLGVVAVGTLVADPQARTGASGKPFTTALMRVATEDESVSVSVIAFSTSAGEVLLAHRKGDIVCIAGTAALSSWTDRDGKERHGMKVVASRVMSPHAAARQREKVAAASKPREVKAEANAVASGARAVAVSADGFVSDIPF